MTFTKADNTIDVNNLDDIKDLIQSSSEGNVDNYDVLQAYKDLSEKYSNEEIATAIEENKELLTEQGISENVIDSGSSVLRSVDSIQLYKILSEDINIDDEFSNFRYAHGKSTYLNVRKIREKKILLVYNLESYYDAIKNVLPEDKEIWDDQLLGELKSFSDL